nr:hypothetical protein CFP56_43788 [Quercus suber]
MSVQNEDRPLCIHDHAVSTLLLPTSNKPQLAELRKGDERRPSYRTLRPTGRSTRDTGRYQASCHCQHCLHNKGLCVHDDNLLQLAEQLRYYSTLEATVRDYAREKHVDNISVSLCMMITQRCGHRFVQFSRRDHRLMTAASLGSHLTSIAVLQHTPRIESSNVILKMSRILQSVTSSNEPRNENSYVRYTYLLLLHVFPSGAGITNTVKLKWRLESFDRYRQGEVDMCHSTAEESVHHVHKKSLSTQVLGGKLHLGTLSFRSGEQDSRVIEIQTAFRRPPHKLILYSYLTLFACHDATEVELRPWTEYGNASYFGLPCVTLTSYYTTVHSPVPWSRMPIIVEICFPIVLAMSLPMDRDTSTIRETHAIVTR